MRSLEPTSEFQLAPSRGTGALHLAAGAAFRPLHALLTFPALLFMATLMAMLFRPPDLHLLYLDRIALVLLIFIALLRILFLRVRLHAGLVTWPLLGLFLVALASLLREPFEAENWSVFAAKWLVPFVLFQIAAIAFDDPIWQRRFELFALILLGYLTVTAIFFLLGIKELIFPPFILDENLGIHADRARGPFLQAAANGVSLNLLGLIALDSYRRRRLGGALALLFALGLPVAILATKTRAVWLSFAASGAALMFSSSARIRQACFFFLAAGGAGLFWVLIFQANSRALWDRLQERSPVEFRLSVYRAGWEMFRERPLLGWGAAQMQVQLTRRVTDFHQQEFFFHNTYLEVAVQHGVFGLALYLWIILDLFRLGLARRPAVAADGNFLDLQFRVLWPVLLGVYLLNACFVVMNYQFVNGLIFTLAGMLSAQNERGNHAIS